MSSQYQALNVHESKIQGLDCHSRTKSNISRSVFVHICMRGEKCNQNLQNFSKKIILLALGLILSVSSAVN